jgi:hypothetical protein
LPTAKRPSAGLRFFGGSPPRPESSHLISGDGLSPIRTFRDDFIPITAANPLTPLGILMLVQNNLRERRRSKVIGFIIAEASAIGLLFIVGSFAVSSQLTNPALALLVNIVTIAAAVAVAIIPIAFFAVAPILPRGS